MLVILLVAVTHDRSDVIPLEVRSRAAARRMQLRFTLAAAKVSVMTTASQGIIMCATAMSRLAVECSAHGEISLPSTGREK